ncbi:MAG: ribosome maturation factor RimM [Oscillospiraceae bacterium]|nr:ribosome maturation factor RimM [Oscillospiraceae bacterium]
MKQYLEAGRVVATHGVRGEVRVQPWSDTPADLCGLKSLYLDDGGARRLEVLSLRPQQTMLLAAFRGCDTIESVRPLINKILYLDRAELQLPADAFFIADLLGCAVVDADTGERYGELVDVANYGANDVYTVRLSTGEERLLPAVPDIVVLRDPAAGIIKIRPIRGLMRDED